jgi:hypothetical protein
MIEPNATAKAIDLAVQINGFLLKVRMVANPSTLKSAQHANRSYSSIQAKDKPLFCPAELIKIPKGRNI